MKWQKIVRYFTCILFWEDISINFNQYTQVSVSYLDISILSLTLLSLLLLEQRVIW